jgi:hypothetical protein
VDEVLHNSLIACQGSDAIISACSVMSAYHVAEKLQIPLFYAFVSQQLLQFLNSNVANSHTHSLSPTGHALDQE